MASVVAVAVGYVVGARTGGKGLDEMIRAARAVRQSDEFADLIAATRVHVAHAVRELATVIEHGVAPRRPSAAAPPPKVG